MTPPDRRRDLRDVQVRTTGIALITVVVVILLGAVGLVRLFEHEQVRQVDSGLLRAGDFLQQARRSGTALPMAPSPDDLAQFVNARGEILYASDRLQGLPVLRPLPTGDGVAAPVTVRVERVGAVRVTAIPFQDGWLLLAGSLRPVDETTDHLRTVLLVAMPLLTLVLAVVIWFHVGKALRPVRLARDREERLVADVSHELRSPLAGIRVLLETESDDPTEIELNRLEALTTLGRLEAIADGLLTVARQTGTRTAELVDLDEVVLDVCGREAARAPVRLDTGAVSAGQVRGDTNDLRRLVLNLVANAVRHAAGTVQVALHEHDGVVDLTVADDGPGIPEDDRQRIFERFTRLDDARSRDQGGTGLGLAIVDAVAAAHGGRVTVRDSVLGGAEFTVSLPASLASVPDHRPTGGRPVGHPAV